MIKKIKIGTRKSRLALYQAELIAKFLKESGYEYELIKITTSGDKFLKDSLAKAGGKGLFIKEIEEALIKKKIDIAVHSLKDMPSILQEDFTLSAFIKRDDPRDVWISPDINDLSTPEGNIIVGTSSLRREAQLKILNNNFKFKILRGNVDTRIRKLDNKEYDLIILSYAGLLRLGIKRDDLTPFTMDDMVPAVGQGVIVVETRKDDKINSLLKKLNHKETEECAKMERELQSFIGGNCFIPFGVNFKKEEEEGEEVTARLFFQAEEKKNYLKLKIKDRWNNRNNMVDRIKKEITSYIKKEK